MAQWDAASKNDAFIQLVSPDQAGHDGSDKTTFCVQHKNKMISILITLKKYWLIASYI